MPRNRTRTDTPPHPHPPPLADQAAAELPVAYGLLALEPGRHGPLLALYIRCPHCGEKHAHTWHPTVGEPTHRTAPCGRHQHRLRLAGYFVQPKDTPENRRVIDRYQALTGQRPETRRTKNAEVASR